MYAKPTSSTSASKAGPFPRVTKPEPRPRICNDGCALKYSCTFSRQTRRSSSDKSLMKFNSSSRSSNRRSASRQKRYRAYHSFFARGFRGARPCFTRSSSTAASNAFSSRRRAARTNSKSFARGTSPVTSPCVRLTFLKLSSEWCWAHSSLPGRGRFLHCAPRPPPHVRARHRSWSTTSGVKRSQASAGTSSPSTCNRLGSRRAFLALPREPRSSASSLKSSSENAVMPNVRGHPSSPTSPSEEPQPRGDPPPPGSPPDAEPKSKPRGNPSSSTSSSDQWPKPKARGKPSSPRSPSDAEP